MVNMYTLAVSALPSPWELVETYDGRYLRTTTDPGQHGATAGNSTHNHPTLSNCGNCSGIAVNYYGGGDGVSVMTVHAHVPVEDTSGSSNNNPLFYTLALYRIDLALWESNFRYFPVGAVLPSAGPISVSGFARFSEADGKLIKLGSPGSSGGRAAHTDHTAVVTLATTNPYSDRDIGDGGGLIISAPKDHPHLAELPAAASASLLPARIETRLYQVIAALDRSPAGSVCFFDGTPPSSWTPASWDGRFLLGADTDPTEAGTDEHPHAGTPIVSAPVTATNQNTTSGSAHRAVNPHTHVVNIALESANHVPEYVSLCPYYLNVTLATSRGAPIMW